MKKIHLTTALALFSTTIYASDEATYLKQQVEYSASTDQVSTEDLEDLYSEIKGLQQESAPTINPKARKQLSDIKGAWTASYNIGSKFYHDKLVINGDIKTKESDGSQTVMGEFFSNGSSIPQPMICGDNKPEFIGADFDCLVVSGGIYQSYYFTLDGNSSITGYFAIGTTIKRVVQSIFDKDYNFVGSRIGDSIQDSQDADQPIRTDRVEYNDQSGAITIPTLYYNNEKYRIILKDSGDLNFKVKAAVKIQ